jgi:4-amino-4-deoxy-L-arabinose transferase-like glycosyltransferase
MVSHSRVLLAAIVLYFAVAALITGHHIAPYVDEAMVFSPARNLVLHGYMGTSVIDTTSELREGMSLRGIDRYTYQIMPFHFIVQAAWYKVIGLGLFQMRALSALFGIFAILAWYIIISRLSGNDGAALLAAALIATDNVVINAGGFGRCDMLCASLSAMAIASYVMLRERNLTVALLVGHCFAAASVFTHPAGMLAAIALVWMPVYLDRARLRIVFAPLVALPYLLGAGLWGLYIMQAPDIFSEQMRTNVAGRLYGISEPWRAVIAEIQMRYLSEFGLRAGDGMVAHLKLFVFALYVFAFFAVWFTPRLRARQGIRVLLLLVISNLVVFTFFEGTKQGFYLVHVVPLYIGLFAIWVVEMWNTRPALKPVLTAVVLAFVSLQLMRTVSVNRKDRFDNEYEPVVQFLQKNVPQSRLIVGSCELAFERGFESDVVDDHRLGYFSGKHPDVVVVGERYREMFDSMKEKHPELYLYVDHLLASEFVTVYDEHDYKVYVRRSL